MLRLLLVVVLAMSTLAGISPVKLEAATVYHRHSRYYERRAHHRTLKRAGIGAAGGAVVGALAGGGKGAVVGGVIGAGAGYLYDRHKRHEREQ